MIFVAAVLILVGCGLWLVSVRRVGDVPHCAVCRYDVRSAIESDARFLCPECGNEDLHAVMLGRLEVLVGRRYLGVGLLLVGVLLGVGAARGVSWIHFVPDGWLPTIARVDSEAAFAEAGRRDVNNTTLPAGVRAKLIDAGLSIEGELRPSVQAFLHDAITMNQLSPVQQSALVDEIKSTVELLARPQVAVGKPCPHLITVGPNRFGLQFQLLLGELRVGGRAIAPPVTPYRPRRVPGHSGAGKITRSFHDRHAAVGRLLTAGTVTLEQSVTIDTGVATYPVELRTTIEVKPAETAISAAERSTETDEAVREGVRVAAWCSGRDWAGPNGYLVSAATRVDETVPVPLAFQPYARVGDETFAFWSGVRSRPATTHLQEPETYVRTLVHPPEPPMEILLLPSARVAAKTTDLTEIWPAALLFTFDGLEPDTNGPHLGAITGRVVELDEAYAWLGSDFIKPTTERSDPGVDYTPLATWGAEP